MSKVNYPMDDIDVTTLSSARQFAEKYERAENRHKVQTQVFQSQIDLSQTIAIQEKKISEISQTISYLHKHLQEEATKASKQAEIKEKIESRRFWINSFLSFVAAAAGAWTLLK